MCIRHIFFSKYQSTDLEGVQRKNLGGQGTVQEIIRDSSALYFVATCGDEQFRFKKSDLAEHIATKNTCTVTEFDEILDRRKSLYAIAFVQTTLPVGLSGFIKLFLGTSIEWTFISQMLAGIVFFCVVFAVALRESEFVCNATYIWFDKFQESAPKWALSVNIGARDVLQYGYFSTSFEFTDGSRTKSVSCIQSSEFETSNEAMNGMYQK